MSPCFDIYDMTLLKILSNVKINSNFYVTRICAAVIYRHDLKSMTFTIDRSIYALFNGTKYTVYLNLK